MIDYLIYSEIIMAPKFYDNTEILDVKGNSKHVS